jgi:hypothetical protein
MTGDGFELRGLVSGTQRLSGNQQDARRFAHNPEVAGSNSAPATRKCRSGARLPDGDRTS